MTCGIGIQNRRRDCEQDADCQDNGSCGIEDKQTKECDAGCCPGLSFSHELFLLLNQIEWQLDLQM